MQRRWVAVTLALTLSGCAEFSSSVTNSIDAMGMTPDYAKGMKNDLQPKKLEAPSVTVTDNVPEGKLTERYGNGRKKFETVVKNRCFDDYLDIYYPDGKLRTHTPLVNCKAQGVSQGYSPQGKLKTEITYKEGLADGKATTYDDNGKVLKTVTYKAGYPASGA